MMRRFAILPAAFSIAAALSGCDGGGGGVPTNGRLIDQVHPSQNYAQATEVQGLLAPANTLASGVIEAPEVSDYPQAIVDRLLASWTGSRLMLAYG